MNRWTSVVARDVRADRAVAGASGVLAVLRVVAGRRPSGLLGALVIGCLFAVCAFGGGRVDASDPSLARFLLKGGKDDLGRKQYDTALTKFLRAEQEDSTLVEAVYWQGVALDRKSDAKGAVHAYRRFAVVADAKARAGGLSRDETALQKTAQERLGALALGEGERRKLDDGFVDALLAFARSTAAKDPVTTAEALKLALGVRPGDAAAKRLLEKLGPVIDSSAAAKAPGGADPAVPDPGRSGRAAAPAGPFQAVKSWSDQLAGHFFGSNNGWSYDDDLLTIDDHDAHITRAADMSVFGARYAFEIDARLRERYGGRPLIGILFAYEAKPVRRFYALFLTQNAVVLHRAVGGEFTDVARVDLDAKDADAWHRLGVVATGRTIEYWVDGRKRGEYEATERVDLAGEPGVFQQNCRTEIRLLRSGVLP